MKFAKPLMITLAALALIGAGIWHFALKEKIAIDRINAASAAKQICSCRFVAEREMESCKTDFIQEDRDNLTRFKISESYIDATGRADQSVTLSRLGGFVSETASFEPDLGCRL